MSSYEFKYKIKGDRNFSSIIYENKKDLYKSVKAIMKGYLKIEDRKINDYSDFEDYTYFHRDYDEYIDGTYYLYHTREDSEGNIIIHNRIDMNDLIRNSGQYEGEDYKPTEEDITYELSEIFGFHTNKIGKLYFIDSDIYINGKQFITKNKKFNKSLSFDLLKLLSLYFYDNMEKTEVLVSELLTYYKSNFKKISNHIKNGLSQKNINTEDIRKTYLFTINRNIEKIYKNQSIFKIKGQLIKRIAIQKE